MANFNHRNQIDNNLIPALCDNLREGAVIVEVVSGSAVYCNKSFRNLFGIAEGVAIDADMIRNFRKLHLSPQEIAEREQSIQKTGHFNDLVEYISCNGESFFVEATITLVNTQNGSYYLYVLNPVDRSFFELVTMGIAMVNQAHEIVSVNPFLLNQFGYQKHEIIGKEIECLIPARFHDQHVQQRKKFSRTGGNRSMGSGLDLFAVRKDGTEFPVEVGLGNYYSDGGRYTIAFINDTSLQKQAEAKLKNLNEELEMLVNKRTYELKQTMKQLELSKNELSKVNAFQKALLDNAGAIIISADESGLIQSINLAAEQQLGYTSEELVGKQTPLYFHDPVAIHNRAKKLSRERRKPVPENMELFFSSVRNGEEIENEWVYIRKDGSKFPVQLHITAMKNAAGDIIGFIGVAIDISKTKKIESELQMALSKEKELGELKSRFVTMASHEFRTPLSTILSSAYLVEKYSAEEEQPKRTRHLQRIISSVALLTDILNDLLSLGKIEEGKTPVKYIDFDIANTMQTNINEIAPTLKGAQRIEYFHQGEPIISLDPALLKHILMNLVSNASKFSPDDSRIEIKTVNNDNALTLSVKDYGIGISAEDQLHLKERFFRGTNAINIQGTGLGLHIVDKYSELMNGRLICKSELYKGTEISITFLKK